MRQFLLIGSAMFVAYFIGMWLYDVTKAWVLQ